MQSAMWEAKSMVSPLIALGLQGKDGSPLHHLDVLAKDERPIQWTPSMLHELDVSDHQQ